MEMQELETILTEMTKPELALLKHQDMLAAAIIKAKDKSVLSWWWLSIPLYMIAVLLMKTKFMRGATLLSNIHELKNKDPWSSFFFFVTVPVVFILVNSISIRKLFFLSGNPALPAFLSCVWFHIVIVGASLLILITYIL